MATEFLGEQILEKLSKEYPAELEQPEQPKRTSTYFSFFGAVRVPEQPRIDLEAAVKSIWYENEYHESYLPLGYEEATVGETDSITATAYVYSDQAILTVNCPAGCWRDTDLVAWPLNFTGPAAVAGSCCNPRFGL